MEGLQSSLIAFLDCFLGGVGVEGFRVQGLGLGFRGFGCKVQGSRLGFWISGCRLPWTVVFGAWRLEITLWTYGLGFGVGRKAGQGTEISLPLWEHSRGIIHGAGRIQNT